MKQFVLSIWDAVMDSRHNPLSHLDLASQHYMMQVLGWIWSMVFSLSFLSIFQFGYVWMGHLLMIGGVTFTVAVFREAQKQQQALAPTVLPLSGASRCIWKLDSEA